MIYINSIKASKKDIINLSNLLKNNSKLKITIKTTKSKNLNIITLF